MTLNTDTPWHRESFDRFVQQRLPQLLGDRLPLADYQVEEQDAHTFTLSLRLGLGDESLAVSYRDLPRPDGDGLFLLDGNYRVVVPYPDRRQLDQAHILCVGEQLYDYIEQRLEPAPEQLAWDDDLVHSWLPLDQWLRDFHLQETSQYLQVNNWLDRHTHLRRLTLIPIVSEPFGDQDVFPYSQYGLVCPYSTPEGPNVGRLLEVARGACIHEGRLERADEAPDSILGFPASMLPFLEHDDSNRALMGINMMRQWISAADPQAPMHETGWFRQQYDQRLASQGTKPEPALVQTGYEPEAADFWGGYNLLTAYIMWDGDTYEDSIAISASAAARMDFPAAVGVGDRLGNRHGAKGMVARILPDEEMPHLPDGTPVELIFSLTSMISRLNFGQQREAVMGRIAQAEGGPVQVPPFQAPKAAALKKRLAAAGLPEDGMEQLTLKGEELTHRSTVGWVYWGRLTHTAAERLETAVVPPGGPEVDMMAYGALRSAGAQATIHALFNTAAAERPDADSLGRRLASGPVAPAAAPSPRFALVEQLLGIAGIKVDLQEKGLGFSFVEPSGLSLARPVPHPWAPGQLIQRVGELSGLPSGAEFDPVRDCYEDLVETNGRLQRMVDSQAPETLIGPAVAQLVQRLAALFAVLLRPEHLHYQARPLFSGQAAIAPGFELQLDQVGLPEDMAWSLFGPQVEREMGQAKGVEERSGAAAQALDTIMARSWVVLYSAQRVLVDEGHGPVFNIPPTAMVAFKPQRLQGAAIRIHPRLCRLMELDFDGDHIEVFLPLTQEAQREAGQTLSVAGHVQRDQEAWRNICDNYHGLVWGLAKLCRTGEGRAQVEALSGVAVDGGQVFDKNDLTRMLDQILRDHGLDRALEVLDQLTQLGFTVCKESGASFNPFLGSDKEWPQQPEDTDWDQWRLYSDELAAAFEDQADFDDNDLGPLILLSESGARGSREQLNQYVGGGLIYREDGSLFVQRSCWRDGLSLEELKVRVPRALWGLASTNQRWSEARQAAQSPVGTDLRVWGRALRSAQPGVVFARAAERGEVEPLTSLASRLFVGLAD
ncbi:MAG: hypothetical protein GKR89_33420 [Candidatus Latescibacteria bacterium]|nr:hypothetical protein [Candidatus Latescibacterota bacterium]